MNSNLFKSAHFGHRSPSTLPRILRPYKKQKGEETCRHPRLEVRSARDAPRFAICKQWVNTAASKLLSARNTRKPEKSRISDPKQYQPKHRPRGPQTHGRT